MTVATSLRLTKDAASGLHEHIPYLGQPGVLCRPVCFDRQHASCFPCRYDGYWILVIPSIVDVAATIHPYSARSLTLLRSARKLLPFPRPASLTALIHALGRSRDVLP